MTTAANMTAVDGPVANVLEVRDLQVSYGGIRAVKGISLDIAEGELVTLIGANGAGKSSTLRALSGMIPAGRGAQGAVRYQGGELGSMPAFQRARAGLLMVPEGRGVFAQLSVDDNLSMGTYARAGREPSRVASDRERVFDLFPRLAERRAQAAGTLSGGEQQMLAIGRALMSRPRLLLLDEPSMGLAPLVVQTIFSVIRAINAEGVAVLLVEQNARAALEIAGRAYVLDSGQITLAGEARNLLDDPRIREAYLGEAEAGP
jgi:branched-chain amino acid transport system ATP-binding protein